MSALDFPARNMAARTRHGLDRLSAFHRARIVITGDSIPAGAHGVSAGGNPLWGDSWASQAIMRCGGRFRAVANTGVAGNTTAQMLARWQTDVLAKLPDIVILQIGANDFAASSSTATIATAMNNIQSMVQQAIAAGVLVVLVTPPANDAAKASFRRVIPYYYRLAEAYDLPLIDMFAATVDPQADTGGGWKAGLSGDGVHPNTAGQAAMAAAAVPILSNLAAYQPRPYLAAFGETTVGNPANLIANGNFTRQTTPGVPNGWTTAQNAAGYGTQDATQAAPAGFTGKEYAFTKTSGAAGYMLQSATTPGMVAPGDRLRFTGGIEVSGLPGSPTGWMIELSGATGTNRTTRPFTQCKHTGSFVFDADMIVEGADTQAFANVYLNDNATYKVRNLTAINLTAMEAVWKPANGR